MITVVGQDGSMTAEAGPYEGVERFEHCARCYGTGQVRAKPRGWRKRTAPPWYLMRKVDCKNCPGERRERTTMPAAPAQETGTLPANP